MKRYERAQSTLDADLYSRVFPSVDRNRIQTAFDNFRSQSVEFEVRRIEIDPNGLTATVRGYERRVAAPRAGTEQRINAERTVTLEKRGDVWVITRLNSRQEGAVVGHAGGLGWKGADEGEAGPGWGGSGSWWARGGRDAVVRWS